MPNWGWYLLGIIIAVLVWGYIRQKGVTVPGAIAQGAGMAISSPSKVQNSATMGTQMGVPYVSAPIVLPNDQPIPVNMMGGIH